MRNITKIHLIAAMLAASLPAQGQTTASTAVKNRDELVVFLNAARQENRTCIIYLDWANSQATCPASDGLFLTQGKRTQFRVVNRKFLSDYTINIDGVTQLKQIPIEDLEEAANLQTPLQNLAAGAAKGVAPKGLATAGLLQLRTAQDFLMELVDEGKSSNPANEILSDLLVVQREASKVDKEGAALDTTWEVLNGAANGRTAQQAFGAPTIVSTMATLNDLYRDETTGEWLLSKRWYDDEDSFRQLIVRINDSVTMVKTFGNTVSAASAKMGSQITGLDDDVAKLNADLNTLNGNITAAQNAVTAFDNLKREIRISSGQSALTALRKAQIKLKLLQDLNTGGTSGKPVLDDAEINHLVDAYAEYLRHAGEIATAGRDSLSTNAALASRSVTQLLGTLCSPATPACGYAQIATTKLEDGMGHLNIDLPAQIDQINSAQSQVLARANQIYDHSAVAEPLDKVIDLSKNSGNLHVYFTVRRVDVFPRFVVPVLTVSGTAQQALALPPPAAAAPATGDAQQPAPSTQDQSNGQVVAHGVFDVHDFYRATVVAAFAFSGVKEVSVKSTTVTSGTAIDGSTCSAATPCSQPFLDKGAYLPGLLVGVTYYLTPKGHDTFPRATNRWNQNLGILGGLSATKLNSYFIGLSYEPAQAFQIGAGINFVSQDAISKQFDPKKVYPGTPSFGGSSSWNHGAFVSVGFNLSIFRKIFGSVTGLGTKAAGAGS